MTMKLRGSCDEGLWDGLGTLWTHHRLPHWTTIAMYLNKTFAMTPWESQHRQWSFNLSCKKEFTLFFKETQIVEVELLHAHRPRSNQALFSRSKRRSKYTNSRCIQYGRDPDERRSFLAAIDTLRFTRVKYERRAKMRIPVVQDSPNDEDEINEIQSNKRAPRNFSKRTKSNGVSAQFSPSRRYQTREKKAQRTLFDSPGSDDAYVPSPKTTHTRRSQKKSKYSKSRGYTVKPCEYPNCDKWSRTRGRCKRHGGGKRCSVENCPKSDQGGGYCIKHGGVSSCKNSAQVKGLCKSHGGTCCRLFWPSVDAQVIRFGLIRRSADLLNTALSLAMRPVSYLQLIDSAENEPSVALWILIGGAIAITLSGVFCAFKSYARQHQQAPKLSVIDSIELRAYDQLAVPFGETNDHAASRAMQQSLPRSSLRPYPR
ncbi:hypothetical protein ACHHYP_05372 [Achlya hypogyna]|uniref:WRKY19-like zinc finger domain-containing protein n=1 Tax=Achlya hypogyna TaxID=1202772 RepID=A0A1V9YY52_ACHHY|nr:hypothetical protein ACHHYP_05372 [Achlya hypogyna]